MICGRWTTIRLMFLVIALTLWTIYIVPPSTNGRVLELRKTTAPMPKGDEVGSIQRDRWFKAKIYRKPDGTPIVCDWQYWFYWWNYAADRPRIIRNSSGKFVTEKLPDALEILHADEERCHEVWVMKKQTAASSSQPPKD